MHGRIHIACGKCREVLVGNSGDRVATGGLRVDVGAAGNTGNKAHAHADYRQPAAGGDVAEPHNCNDLTGRRGRWYWPLDAMRFQPDAGLPARGVGGPMVAHRLSGGISGIARSVHKPVDQFCG